MVMLLQGIGVAFGLFMLYLTWHYYHKNAYTYRSLAMWFFIWIAFITFTLAPGLLDPLTSYLRVSRVFDLFIVGGLFMFSAVVFYLYVITKRTEKRVEDLVSKLARNKK